MSKNTLRSIVTYDVPENPEDGVVYHLKPKASLPTFYNERTNRNIGWITPEEQEALASLVVCVAGCGGMGGLAAEKLLRLGVGEIRIADPEVFDASNMNRQFAATRSTVGKSKAFETARMLREISDDSTIVVYPQGIEPDMLDQFLIDSTIVVDEIEFWNIGSCILLHQRAREHGVSILNALTVGFAAYVHLFTPESMPVEEMLGMTLSEAMTLERRILDGSVTQEEREHVMGAALDCFVPEFPTYYGGRDEALNTSLVLQRLKYEGRAPIIATNPPFAGGLVTDHTLLYILDQLKIAERTIPNMPVTPGYLKIDAAEMTAFVIKTRSIGS